jgi:hypothetical protein
MLSAIQLLYATESLSMSDSISSTAVFGEKQKVRNASNVGELMKGRWGDSQRLFFEERLSETVPLLDMRPYWRRHVLACWDRRLEKRLTRRSSLGRPGPYGVGRARGGASAADGLARKPLAPYLRSEVQVTPEWRIGRDLLATAAVELGLSVWRNEHPRATLAPCRGDRRPRSLAAEGR